MATAIQDEAEGTHAGTFRGRLLEGLAESIGQRGYRATTVADVVRYAKTSKRTFYDQFPSKEECFIELLRTNNEDLIATIRGAVEPDASWDDQIRSAVSAYVDHISSRPAITLSWIREAPALGPVAGTLHRQAMAQLTGMLVDLTSSPGFDRARLPAVSPPLALILLGGLRELTALFVEDGVDVQDIREPAIAASIAILGPTPG